MPYVQEVGPEILVAKIVEIYLDSATLLSKNYNMYNDEVNLKQFSIKKYKNVWNA